VPVPVQFCGGPPESADDLGAAGAGTKQLELTGDPCGGSQPRGPFQAVAA